MIVASLLLIVVAVVLLALGLADGTNGYLVGSIAASLFAAIALIVSGRRGDGGRQAQLDADDELEHVADLGVDELLEPVPIRSELAIIPAAVSPAATRTVATVPSARVGAGSAGRIHAEVGAGGDRFPTTAPDPGGSAAGDPVVGDPVVGDPIVGDAVVGGSPGDEGDDGVRPTVIESFVVASTPDGPSPGRSADGGDGRAVVDGQPPDRGGGPGVVPAQQPAPAVETVASSGTTPGEPVASSGPAGSVPGSADVDEVDEFVDEEPPDEPPAQLTVPGDAARVARSAAPVFVIDARPRYHLRSCVHLLGRQSEQLPVSEAVELGFTPCGLCEPDTRILGRPRRRG